MAHNRCHLTDDEPATAGAVAPGFYSGRGDDDGGPRPRRRGNFSGFLPANLVNDLRASADSGAGLAVLDLAPVRRERDGLLLLLALTSLYLAFRNGR